MNLSAITDVMTGIDLPKYYYDTKNYNPVHPLYACGGGCP